jgi:hypothetical protein
MKSMNITVRTALFILAAMVMTLMAAFLCSPAGAAQKVQLPGANLSAPIEDNPIADNNGEGHDLDDIAELREHWRNPLYSQDERRQMAGMLVITGSIAGFSLMTRKSASAKQ